MKDKIEVALRVLSAIQKYKAPLPADVKSLQSWVDSSYRHADPDDLACIVITDELQRKKNSRIMQDDRPS
jgi:hypothetical protein